MTDHNQGRDPRFYYGMVAGLGITLLIILMIVFSGNQETPVKDPVQEEDEIIPDLTFDKPAGEAPFPKPGPGTLLLDIETALEAENAEYAAELLIRAEAEFPGDPRFTILQARLTELESVPTLDESQFAVFRDSALRALENEQWSLAVSGLETALSIKDDAELAALLPEAQFNMYSAQAATALKEELIEQAYTAVNAALAIRKTPELEEMQTVIENARNKERDLEQRLTQYEAIRSRGELAFSDENYIEAAELFKEAAQFTTVSGHLEYLDSRRLACEQAIAKDLRDSVFQQFMDQARKVHENGNPREALALYRKAHVQQPDNAEAIDKIAELESLLPPQNLTDTVGKKMQLLPGGSIMMGTPDGAEDARPVHRIELKPFYMDTTEVTNAEYALFDPDHTRPSVSAADTMPVTNITWQEAVDYCAWRTGKTGAVYRLPTEAEWEFAARGNQDLKWSWGNTFDTKSGCAELSRKGTAAADAFKPNPFGLFNLSGNAWEWCSDWYAPDYYASSPVKNPTGPENGTHRVVRGGSFRFSADACRSWERNAELPDQRVFDIGFRCVRELPENMP